MLKKKLPTLWMKSKSGSIRNKDFEYYEHEKTNVMKLHWYFMTCKTTHLIEREREAQVQRKYTTVPILQEQLAEND